MGKTAHICIALSFSEAKNSRLFHSVETSQPLLVSYTEKLRGKGHYDRLVIMNKTLQCRNCYLQNLADNDQCLWEKKSNVRKL